jgi:hypothetical protein
MLTLLISTSWACLVICGVLVIAATKRTVAISVEDAKVMWTLHKRNSRCNCKSWRLIKQKKGKVRGFQCECGFKYSQKKPLLS